MAVSAWFFFSVAVLGALQVSAVSVRLLAHLSLFPGQPIDLRRLYGAWAVVTGPTAGIGRWMSLELAGRGLNIVLVGRDPDKLRDMSETISMTHGVQTRIVVFDLSLVGTAEGEEALRGLREAVEGLEVGVLVNNAAVVKPGAMYMHEAGIEFLVRIIRVNVLALTEVTATVLTGMIRRGRGTVVNVGSASSLAIPFFPLYSVYGATKRYVLEFSRSLSVEYKSRGVHVQCQLPFLVETNMVSTALKASLFPWFIPAQIHMPKMPCHGLATACCVFPALFTASCGSYYAFSQTLSPIGSCCGGILSRGLSFGGSDHGGVKFSTSDTKSGGLHKKKITV